MRSDRPTEDKHLELLATGIGAFDRIVGGGLPKGSVTLLLGEVGAGAREFAHSSLLAVLASKRDVAFERVAYVSTSRTRQQVERELDALAPGLDTSQSARFRFCDLSPWYFRESIAPTEWIGGPDMLSSYGSRDVYKAIFDFVEAEGKGSLVVLDTLTDLLSDPDSFRDLVPFLRGLARFAAAHGSLVFAVLPSTVLRPNEEAALAEACDGTLVFTWSTGSHGVKRRHLWVKDFRGLTPALTEKNLSEFTAEISPGSGFGLKSLSRIG